jgi:hypothetical protein
MSNLRGLNDGGIVATAHRAVRVVEWSPDHTSRAVGFDV